MLIDSMIFWIILFLLVILVSFILAFQSMKDFAEKPSNFKSIYGLFLVKNLKAVNSELLKLLHFQLVPKGLIFSIEKLFKGKMAALVIFGPSDFLKQYSQILDLLELEEYTNVDPKEVLSWEVLPQTGSLSGIPQLLDSEHFWWQVILKPQKKDYLCQIRAAVWIKDEKRRAEVAQKLQQLDSGRLKKVPVPFTSGQILDMYKDRSIISSVPTNNLSAAQVLDLVKMKN